MDSQRTWNNVGWSLLALLQLSIAVPLGSLSWLFLARGDLVTAAIFGSSVDQLPLGFFPFNSGPLGLAVALFLATPGKRRRTWFIAPITIAMVGALTLVIEVRLQMWGVADGPSGVNILATLLTLVWASTFVASQLSFVVKNWSLVALFAILTSIFAVVIVLMAGGSQIELALWVICFAIVSALSLVRRLRANRADNSERI